MTLKYDEQGRGYVAQDHPRAWGTPVADASDEELRAELARREDERTRREADLARLRETNPGLAELVEQGRVALDDALVEAEKEV